ncbi:Flagellar hook-length control protein [compost metagenome]
MDISILSAAASSAGNAQRSSSSPATGSEGSFAQRLEQAVGNGSATASTADSPSTDAPGSNSPSSDTPVPPAAGEAPSAAGSAAVGQATQTPARSALPALLAEQSLANATVASTAVPGAPGDSPASAPVQPLDALDEIRRRMKLIEQAGQLPGDMAAAGMANGFIPPQNPAGSALASTTPALGTGQAISLDGLRSLSGRPPEAAGGQPAASQAALPDAAAQQPATTIGVAAGNGADSAPLENNASLPLADSPARSETTSATPLNLNGSTAVSTPATTPAANPALATLAAPLASREWQQGLGQQLIGLHQRGEQQIELHLHPADLGPLSISLKLGELGAQAQFLSAHPQVRAAIEQAIPQLREALASQGISLGETSVGEQHQPQRDSQAGSGAGGGSATAASEVLDNAQITTTSAPARPLSLGQVDLYA